jgi:hypothetical protein
MSVILAQLSKRTKLIDIFKRAKLLKINILQAAACRLNSVALLTYVEKKSEFTTTCKFGFLC